MRLQTVNLKEHYNISGGKLQCYLTDFPFDEPNHNWVRPAVVIVPGGGYNMVSKREAEPCGNYFLSKGFQVFILDYLCWGDNVHYPEQLFELGCAVDYIKNNAQSFNVNPNQVFAVGFSAGGHLVCNLQMEYKKVEDKFNAKCKPTAVGLCYPVISPEGGHKDSFDNLFYGVNKEEKERLFALHHLDKLANANTPPAFIWTTSQDNCVPPVNSLLIATALSKQGVKFELHIYPEGHHGLSTCDTEVNSPNDFLTKNSHWLDDCQSFFKLFM